MGETFVKWKVLNVLHCVDDILTSDTNDHAHSEFLEALKYFEKSEELDPKNGLNRFQKANTLVKLEKYDSAI